MCFKAKSTKTRIETHCIDIPFRHHYVLKQNPPKQGLKPFTLNDARQQGLCFKAKSTKTRIETDTSFAGGGLEVWVLKQNPPKQGLKLMVFH